MQPTRTTGALIDELVRSTGAADAPAAIRAKAKELIALQAAMFGEPTMPINVDVLASLRGIQRSDELPVHSPDAELVPDGRGGVTMRVNPDRPETRLRFSVAHEISHTFFPDYTTKAWCRTDARYRDRSNPDDFLEMLCDVAAAELLLPDPWFSKDAAAVSSAQGLSDLASTYRASREATVRRYAERNPFSVTAVFFSWKLKPTQHGTVGREDQTNLFGISAAEEVRDALKLRIEYCVPSPTFIIEGLFLPKDKSVERDGPIYAAASTGRPTEGEHHLDLGQASGTYRIWAIPLWTPDDELGAKRENAVAAVICPLKIRKAKKKIIAKPGTGLFD
ncbi:ImmA/IrrE family metallo-endopeptidase [Fimbriiglobus ruber]|uniref:ImmA/IrrE family metallo-endopeptidase n=1 Tax=Fimbriiglobus ruber TaxID=1908690 RepID=UPI0013797A89|nr:ImmA/IrrE family metallo-endopeptidase [Fimbriiglobus ruber]